MGRSSRLPVAFSENQSKRLLKKQTPRLGHPRDGVNAPLRPVDSARSPLAQISPFPIYVLTWEAYHSNPFPMSRIISFLFTSSQAGRPNC